ncbi:MAG: DUF3846 domain-containing protein [Ruminococcaceae bacterium]|nr:DUF3846 domain-containing protein [Oscillospiraceae bacterium]
MEVNYHEGKGIKVLKVEPGKAPEVVFLKNELHELQKAVSIGAPDVGLIEIIDINDEVCILCNEEGKLLGLEPNRRFRNDILVGVFYVCGQDYDEGELASLSEPMLEHCSKLFAIPDVIDPDEVKILTEFYVI